MHWSAQQTLIRTTGRKTPLFLPKSMKAQSARPAALISRGGRRAHQARVKTIIMGKHAVPVLVKTAIGMQDASLKDGTRCAWWAAAAVPLVMCGVLYLCALNQSNSDRGRRDFSYSPSLAAHRGQSFSRSFYILLVCFLGRTRWHGVAFFAAVCFSLGMMASCF